MSRTSRGSRSWSRVVAWTLGSFAVVLATAGLAIGTQSEVVQLDDDDSDGGGVGRTVPNADIVLESDGTVREQAGFAMAMGFLNGDRFADLVVGAPGDEKVYVFYGGIDVGGPAEAMADRTMQLGTADLVLELQAGDESDGGLFGFSVAISRQSSDTDFSGALLVGAPATNDDTLPGFARLFPPSCFSGGACAPVTFTGEAAGDEAGYAVAIGNVRGGAGDDYLISARSADGERGAVYLFENSAVTGDTDLSTATSRLRGSADEEGLGEFLIVDDFDAGSLDEVAIGAVGTVPAEENTSTGDLGNIPGYVYVARMSAGTGGTLGAANRIEGTSRNEFFGFSMASGDLDDDGLVELAVGAIFYDRTDERDVGAAFLIDDTVVSGLVNGTGTSQPADAVASVTLEGQRAFDELGFSMASGDVDNSDDPNDDLLVSARRFDRTQTGPEAINQVDEGAVYVLLDPFAAADGALACVATCGPGDLPAGVDSMIFGGDFGRIPNSSEPDLPDSYRSDQVGFNLVAGDFNGGSQFSDIATSSIAHDRVYLLSLENTNNNASPTPAGQEIDDLVGDIRDRDDDGDGYLDAAEDDNGDGFVDADESDPLVPNTDITVDLTLANSGDLTCDGTILATVVVTNAAPNISIFQPELRVLLPDLTQPDSGGLVFEYVPGTTTVGGAAIADGGGGTFPLGAFTDLGSVNGSVVPLAAGGTITVTFQLRANLPLDFALANDNDDVDADVRVPESENELPSTSALASPNSDSELLTLLFPELEGEVNRGGPQGGPAPTKRATDVDGGALLDPLDQIQYTIVITNTGTYQATQVDVSDEVPANTTLVTNSLAVNVGGTPITQPTPNDLTSITVGTIPVGQAATITFDVIVDEDVEPDTVVSNQATITEACITDPIVTDSTDGLDFDPAAAANDPDLDGDDDPTLETVTVNEDIDLTTVTVTPAGGEVGDTITVAFDVTTGTGNVRLNSVGVAVTDSLPRGICQGGSAPALAMGDTNTDGFLDWLETGDGAETHRFECSYTIRGEDAVGTAAISETATASGTSPRGFAGITDDEAVAINVINTAPVGGDDDAGSTATNTAVLAIPVLDNDTDVNLLQTLTVISAGASPACNSGVSENGGALTVNGGTTIDYDPATGFKGNDSFCYVVSDSIDTDTATVSVVVLNAPPVGVDDDAGTTPTDTTAAAIPVLDNDTDLNTADTLSVLTAGTGPDCNDGASAQGGTVTVNGGTTIDYTPATGFEGNDEFCYVVSDAEDTDTATVTIEVLNAPPVAVDDDAGSTPTDTAVNGIDVLANDTDANPADTVTIASAGSAPDCTDNMSDNGGTLTVGATIDYTPALGFSGTDTFCYVATDGDDTDTATVTVEVLNAAPTAVDDPLGTTPANTDVNGIDVLTNDTDPNPADTLSVVSAGSNAPDCDNGTTDGAGAVTVIGNATINYNPEDSFEGPDSFCYVLSDGTSTDTATVTITVENAPPAAMDDDAGTTPANTNVAGIDVLTNDSDANTFDTLSVASAGVSPDCNNGATTGGGSVTVTGGGTTIDYDPEDSFEGVDMFCYVLSDGTDTDTANVTVTVQNAPPAAMDDDAGSTPFNTDLTGIDVLANDTDANSGDLPLTIVSVGSTPTCVDGLTDNAGAVSESGGAIDYNPEDSFVGVDTFCYVVTDGDDTDTADVTVTVSNGGPIAAPDDAGSTANDTDILGIDLLTNDSDPNMDPLSVDSVGSNVPNCDDNLSAGGGTLTLTVSDTVDYSPLATFKGMDSFCYILSDGTDTAQGLVTLTVDNAAPVPAGDGLGTTPHDTAVTGFDLLGNDNDANMDTLSIASVGSVSPCTDGVSVNGGAITINGGLTIDYAPDTPFRGLDNFCYVVSDGEDTAEAAVTVTVLNDQPDAMADDAGTTPPNTDVLGITVLANDDDGNTGDTLTVLSAGNNSPDCNDGLTSGAGAVVVMGGATVDYNPADTFRGMDTFCYVVDDGSGEANSSNFATVTVTVDNAAPMTTADDAGTTAANTDVLGIDVLTNDMDANMDMLMVTSAGNNAPTCDDGLTAGGGAVTVMGGATIDYNPEDAFKGGDSFCYIVNDGSGAPNATAMGTVMVTVSNAPPVAILDTGFATTPGGADVVIPVTMNDNDDNMDLLTVISAGNNVTFDDLLTAEGGTLAITGVGEVTYTPPAAATGNDTFVYVVSDGEDVDSAQVQIDLGFRAPDATDDDASTSFDEMVNVVVLANDSGDNAPLTVVSAGTGGQTAMGGSVTVKPDQTIDYMPPGDFVGMDSFDYMIQDAMGMNATATVHVTITFAGEVLAPQFTDLDADWVSWTTPSSADTYHLYYGDLQTLRDSGTYSQQSVCDLAASSVPGGTVPTPTRGQTLFFLVTAANELVESGLGQTSAGIERPNDGACGPAVP